MLSRLARLGMGAIQPVQGLHTLQHVIQGAARKACLQWKSGSAHPASSILHLSMLSH